MKRLNKLAFVLGGSGEIGSAISYRLAKDGFTVVVHYHRNKSKAETIVKKILKLGGEALIASADIRSESHIEKMISGVSKKYDSIDVLINCIGINNSEKSLSRISSAKFRQIIDINLCGVALVTKKLLPLIKKSELGRIIFVSSILAFIGSARRPAYAAAKGGIMSFAKSLALDLAPKILVNTVVPSYIDTKMIRQSKTESLKNRIKRIPLKRLGKPEEVADLISFLCSEKSSYIHGQNIHINGGSLLT